MAEADHGGRSDPAEQADTASVSAEITHGEGRRGERQQLPRGATVGRYVILDRIGAGGMGVVYSAYDPELDRRVAIKLLRPGVARDKQQRLLREAQAMARLSHPNVIAVHDVGTFGDQVFIACEFVDGPSLADWRKARARSWQETLAMYVEAGRGLAAAHSAGLVHRDFKPQNVLVDARGHARVLDFGLARSTDEMFIAPDPVDGEAPLEPVSPTKALETPLTRAGTIVGTPAYMSPEQLRGEPVDARTDQFSFCVAVYEAIFGERPFIGDTQGLVEHGVEPTLRPPRGDDVPPWLRTVLLRGLSLRPADRWPLLDDLLAQLEPRPVAPAPPSRRWLWATLAGVVAASAITGGVLARARHERTLCGGADEKLASAWGPAQRTAITAAFMRSGFPAADEAVAHVSAALDRYAHRWAEAWTDSCRATHVRGEQSAELLDLRTQCYQQRLVELRATTDLLASADVKLVSEAGRAVSALSRVEDCADVAALKAPARLPRDPAARAQIDAVETDLATARTLGRAGRYTAAIAPATSARDRARRIGARALEAEGLFELANATYRAGDTQKGVAMMEEAAFTALAAGDDFRAGRAWASLVFFGDEVGRLDRAAEWSRLGLAASERLGNPPSLLAQVYNNTATLIDDQGKHQEAIALYEKSIALAHKAHDDFGEAMAVNNVAVTWATLGHDDKALPLYRQAYTLWNDALGSAHPSTLMALENLAELLCRMDLLDEAEASVRRSIATRDKILGPGNPDGWFAVGTLADILYKRGRYTESLRWAELQAQLLTRGFGPKSSRLAGADLLLAEIYDKMKQTARARTLLEQALALDTGHDEVVSAEVRYRLALALESSGELRRARTLMEEARPLVADRTDARALEQRSNINAWLVRHAEPAVSRQ